MSYQVAVWRSLVIPAAVDKQKHPARTIQKRSQRNYQLPILPGTSSKSIPTAADASACSRSTIDTLSSLNLNHLGSWKSSDVSCAQVHLESSTKKHVVALWQHIKVINLALQIAWWNKCMFNLFWEWSLVYIMFDHDMILANLSCLILLQTLSVQITQICTLQRFLLATLIHAIGPYGKGRGCGFDKDETFHSNILLRDPCV